MLRQPDSGEPFQASRQFAPVTSLDEAVSQDGGRRGRAISSVFDPAELRTRLHELGFCRVVHAEPLRLPVRNCTSWSTTRVAI
jgi:hypothetical protein